MQEPSHVTRLMIRAPDDWHVHLRDGPMLGSMVDHTARQFRRAIVMPNLDPPVTTTEQAIAALRRMAVASARITRDGRITSVPVAELVPGDVVHLDAGAVVPADLRLFEVASLRIEEAALTGESEPVDKQVEAIDRANAEVIARAKTIIWNGPLGVFEITGVGLPVAAVGIVVLVLTAPRALRHRQGASSESSVSTQPYTIAMRVDAGGPLVGQTIDGAGLRHLHGVFLADFTIVGAPLTLVTLIVTPIVVPLVLGI